MDGDAVHVDKQLGHENELKLSKQRRSRSPLERRSRSPLDKDRTKEQDDNQKTVGGIGMGQLQERLKILSDEPAVELNEDEKLMMSVMGFHSFNTTKRIFDEPVETRADDDEGDGGGYVDRGRTAYRGSRGGYRDQGSGGSGYGRGSGYGGGARGGHGGERYEGGGGYGSSSRGSGGYGGGRESNYGGQGTGRWHADNY